MVRPQRPVAPEFKPQRAGLGQVLGELETDIMEAVWSAGEMTVREVHGVLLPKRELAYTTVMTVMTRLAEKGLLARVADGNSYLYRPTLTRQAFVSQAVGEVVNALLSSHAAQTISHFATCLDRVSSEELRQLEEMLKRRRGG